LIARRGWIRQRIGRIALWVHLTWYQCNSNEILQAADPVAGREILFARSN